MTVDFFPASVCNSSAIEKVTMPESVTSIGSSAFYGCENLKDVYYVGSEEEWLKISIGSDNENLTNATIHYNSTMPDSVDPGSEDEEYFAILKDNNCWRHNRSSFFGENEEHRYLISDDYFQQLLRQVGKHSVESSVLYWDRNSEWKGSCFGLTIAMSLANIGDLYDVTHGRDFYRLGAPKDIEEEPELRNVINYFQLMQKIIDPDLLTYKDNVTNGILNGADKETFLKLLVQEAKNSEKTHSPFVFTYCYNYRDYLSKDECESLGIKGKGGHSVVVCGYQYAKNADGNYEHQIQIYDPNDLGRYYYLYIEEDYSSFDYQDFLMHDHTMNLGSQYDKEIRLEYIYDWMGFYGIDCLKNMENTRISKPVIPATDNLNQSIELHSDPDEINTEQVKLFISLDHPFVLKNTKGETLSYDGEKFDGTMKVYASKMIGEENLEMILSTDASDSFSITSTDSNFEIAAEIDENCYIVSSNGADSARLSKENGVVLEGDVYTFSAAAGTDLESCEMVKFSGKGSGLCNLKQTKEGIQLDTENNSFSDVTVETYKGMEYNSEKVDGKAEYVSVTDGEEGETVIETDGTVSDDNQGSNENEYKINSLQILDGDGQALENIPAGEFYVDADLSKSDKAEDALLVLAAYDSGGRMLRLYCEKLGDAETAETDTDSTVSRKIRVENPDGEVAEVRTFVLRSLGMPVSLCSAVSVGNDSAIG